MRSGKKHNDSEIDSGRAKPECLPEALTKETSRCSAEKDLNMSLHLRLKGKKKCQKTFGGAAPRAPGPDQVEPL